MPITKGILAAEEDDDKESGKANVQKKEFPEKFIERMEMQLGSEELDRFVDSLGKPMEHGLRVNTGRMTPEEFRLLSPWKLSPIPWCPSGFYLDEDGEGIQPSRHPFYSAGAYYLQEPSAMLPAAALPVEPGDRVLDLCSAPGGKSTALGEKLAGSGVLFCNDISASRLKALVHNIELFGIENAVVTAETPERLAGVFPDYFDKILIDAPCSGEGMFRKSSKMVSDWTEDKPKEYAALQREILPHAIRMLRPGGMLLYSTCTYAPEEDEGTVQFILDHPEAKEKGLVLADIPMAEGFLPGDPSWIEGGREDLSKTVHLIPHRVRGEGHFAALFSGNASDPSSLADRTGGKVTSSGSFDPAHLKKKCPEFAEFAGAIKRSFSADRLSLRQGYLSYLPDLPGKDDLAGKLAHSGLRMLRQGLFLGEVKKNRFEPSQALAMTLGPDTFRNTLQLTPDDERVLRYLKGETLEYDDKEASDGWVLITIGNLPLGFGKAKDGRIKNKYLPGWRWDA